MDRPIIDMVARFAAIRDDLYNAIDRTPECIDIDPVLARAYQKACKLADDSMNLSRDLQTLINVGIIEDK